METTKQSNNMRIYYDAERFKGNTFEQNINIVNKLYLGLGLKISDVPYIYIGEKDNNTYLSANCFIIETKEEEPKIINYPISFLYQVFYHNNLLFHLDSNNQLNVYKFDKEKLSIVKCLIQQKKNEMKKNSNITPVDMEKVKVSTILEKLEKINKNNNLREDYEILCDILGNDLGIALELKYPKPFKGTLIFEIKDTKFHPLEYTCTIKQVKYQIDEVGMIREKIILDKGKTTFKEGIDFFKQYTKYKDKILLNNTFKCPILFKNFEEAEIPPEKVILCEIKSGFDIEEIKRQLIERIEAIRYFIFNKDENPLYYIGIVNLNSNNADKLTKYSEYIFEMNENILIVAAVDFKYFGIDLSYETNTGYLLYKKIDNLENEMKNRFNALEIKIDTNFANLIKEMKNLHPNLKFNYFANQEKYKNIGYEEKKGDA